MTNNAMMSLVIVSGRSGSGKSCALHALEDLGYYCVDNLPTRLIPSLVQELQMHESRPNINNPITQTDKIAIGLDARSLRVSDASFRKMLNELAHFDNLETQVIYLDADDETLLKRFSETRRKHPMSSEHTSLLEALELEKKIISPLITDSTTAINTSSLSLHQLREEIARLVDNTDGQMSILLQSFGFKHGIPKNSDLIFDVRCLVNPHWVPQLRPKTGLDLEVATFLGGDDKVVHMKNTIIDYLHTWLPEYKINNRRYFTVSIGCTGGQHRSVFLAQEINTALADIWSCQVRHCQLGV